MSGAARGTLGWLAAVVLVVAALELFALGLFRSLEHQLLDVFVRSHAARLAPDPDIVLVDIDEPSLAKMQDIAGRWPWPRAVHAELIDGIAAQRPRAIVFDIMLSEPDRFRPESDQVFVEAVAKHRNIYFPLVLLDRSDDPYGVPAGELTRLVGLIPGPDADPNARIALIPPLVLPPEQWRAGTINFLEDADGVGRRYALRTRLYGWTLLSLPARVARDLGWTLPAGDDMVLAWRGRAGDFPHVSYSDLYEDFNRSKRERAADEFTGKIVIVGTGAPGLKDLRVTPLASLHAGGEILGTALENLKNGRRMHVASTLWPALAGVVLLVLLVVAFLRNLDARLTGAVLMGASLALLGTAYAAVGRLVLLPLLTPLVAAWLFYFAAALAAYLRERRSREEAIAQFSRFVNPHVVSQLLERGGLEGAGQTREVTLLFSDIRGFTTLSETRAPAEVVDLLNRYFTLQVAVVFRHGGTLDKFIGDAIMAVWGAPLEDAGHAVHAVRCALDMADTLERFQGEIGDIGADFDVGIGIHSGPAVVGLIGSDQRREYTSIGDTVNLASRIEGLTKDAKRRILVSRETMERCGEAFDFQSCGSYKVKGRAQEVELFVPRRKQT
ncbi:MAG: adenylate/guanylate cyclase domain-containing protein [bacterium]